MKENCILRAFRCSKNDQLVLLIQELWSQLHLKCLQDNYIFSPNNNLISVLFAGTCHLPQKTTPLSIQCTRWIYTCVLPVLSTM